MKNSKILNERDPKEDPVTKLRKLCNSLLHKLLIENNTWLITRYIEGKSEIAWLE